MMRIVVAIVLMLLPSPAMAHILHLFAYVEGTSIHGNAYFQGGSPARGAAVTAIDPAGREIGRATTDEEGKFSFPTTTRCDYRLSVATGDGHGAEYTVHAAELPDSLPAGPSRSGPPDSTTITAESTPTNIPSDDAVAREIKALNGQIVGLRQQVDENENRTRFRDYLGGIGFILGLSGIAFYLMGAKAQSTMNQANHLSAANLRHHAHREVSYLEQIDPRVRIVSAVVLSIAVAAIHSNAALGVALAAAIAGVVMVRRSFMSLLGRLIPLEVFMIACFIVLSFSSHGRPGFSREGFMHALVIAVKAHALVLGLMALVGTMDAITLGHALVHLYVPRKLVLLLLFMVRYLDVLDREAQRLRSAMAVRSFRPKMNRHTYRSYGHLAGMLLVRAFDRSDRVLAAMKCRGFQGYFYLLDHFAFSARRDLPFCAAVVMLLAVLVGLERG